MALANDPAALELETGILLRSLMRMLAGVVIGGNKLDGRVSQSLAAERLTTAVSDLARAMTCFRRENERQCLTDLLAAERAPAVSVGVNGIAPGCEMCREHGIQTSSRMAVEEKTLRESEIQKAFGMPLESETFRQTEIQNAPQQPPRQGRGAPAGNQRALKHGRFTRAAKAERAAFRASLRRVKELKIEARRLASERGRLAAKARASG